MINGQNSPIAAASSNLLTALTDNGVTVSANSKSQYVVAGQTLSPGGTAIVESGITYSVASLGTALIAASGTTRVTEGIGGAIMSGLGLSTDGSGAVASVFTLGTQTVTAYPVASAAGGMSSQDIAIAIGSTTVTLAPGGSAAAVGSAHTLSEASAGGAIVAQSAGELATTISLARPTAEGYAPSSTASSTPEAYTGGAVKARAIHVERLSTVVVLLVISLVAVV